MDVEHIEQQLFHQVSADTCYPLVIRGKVQSSGHKCSRVEIAGVESASWNIRMSQFVFFNHLQISFAAQFLVEGAAVHNPTNAVGAHFSILGDAHFEIVHF